MKHGGQRYREINKKKIQVKISREDENEKKNPSVVTSIENFSIFLPLYIFFIPFFFLF